MFFLNPHTEFFASLQDNVSVFLVNPSSGRLGDWGNVQKHEREVWQKLFNTNDMLERSDMWKL